MHLVVGLLYVDPIPFMFDPICRHAWGMGDLSAFLASFALFVLILLIGVLLPSLAGHEIEEFHVGGRYPRLLVSLAVLTILFPPLGIYGWMQWFAWKRECI
ncbi:hypothetical protein [Nitratifractor sp.]